MRYWWVNQKQTNEYEIPGGYLWSPKRNQNEARNQYYENMREVAPGDLVLSYWDLALRAYGVAQSYCYDCPRPDGFSEGWDAIGYRVDVRFTYIERPLFPKGYMDRIRPLMPQKYAPLQAETGNGLQNLYLAALSGPLGGLLVNLLNATSVQVPVIRPPSPVEAVPRVEMEHTQWEEKLETQLRAQAAVSETEREELIRSRRGQGVFKYNVAQVERACRITGVSDASFLIASHIKPWRYSSNPERLDGNNGLLLSPNVDFLFDRGFISFEDNGDLLVSPVASPDTLRRMGVDVTRTLNVGAFNRAQQEYLRFHRAEIFLSSRP